MREREDYKGWYYVPETTEGSEIANDLILIDKLKGHSDVRK
jgi:hypothetical protein